MNYKRLLLGGIAVLIAMVLILQSRNISKPTAQLQNNCTEYGADCFIGCMRGFCDIEPSSGEVACLGVTPDVSLCPMDHICDEGGVCTYVEPPDIPIPCQMNEESSEPQEGCECPEGEIWTRFPGGRTGNGWGICLEVLPEPDLPDDDINCNECVRNCEEGSVDNGGHRVCKSACVDQYSGEGCTASICGGDSGLVMCADQVTCCPSGCDQTDGIPDLEGCLKNAEEQGTSENACYHYRCIGTPPDGPAGGGGGGPIGGGGGDQAGDNIGGEGGGSPGGAAGGAGAGAGAGGADGGEDGGDEDEEEPGDCPEGTVETFERDQECINNLCSPCNDAMDVCLGPCMAECNGNAGCDEDCIGIADPSGQRSGCNTDAFNCCQQIQGSEGSPDCRKRVCVNPDSPGPGPGSPGPSNPPRPPGTSSTPSSPTVSSTPGFSASSTPPSGCTSNAQCSTTRPDDCVAYCSGGDCLETCRPDNPVDCRQINCYTAYCGADDCGGCCPSGPGPGPGPGPGNSSSSTPTSSTPSSPTSSTPTSSTPSSPTSSTPTSSSPSSRPPTPGFCCQDGFCANCDDGGGLGQCLATCGLPCPEISCPAPEVGCTVDPDAQKEDCGCPTYKCEEECEEVPIESCPDPEGFTPPNAGKYDVEVLCWNAGKPDKCACPTIACVPNTGYCCNTDIGQCIGWWGSGEMEPANYGKCTATQYQPQYYSQDLDGEYYHDRENSIINMDPEIPDYNNSNGGFVNPMDVAYDTCSDSCSVVTTSSAFSSGFSAFNSDSITSTNNSDSRDSNGSTQSDQSDPQGSDGSTASTGSTDSDNSFYSNYSNESLNPAAPSTSSVTSVALSSAKKSSIQSAQKSSRNSEITLNPPTCGDGLMNQVFEECDDGNITEYDGCNSICQIETRGPYDNPDDDDGNGDNDDGIKNNDDDDDGTKDTRDYGVPPVCGDGKLQVSEQCDDSNVKSGDGCNSSCFLESGTGPKCGDAILTLGESCDYGELNANKPNFCRTDCSAPTCGDSITDDRMKEECDDGNVSNNDGCNSECKIEEQRLVAAASVCGNGVLEIGEECDDSNRRDNDGCTTTCLLEIGICGDGVVQSLLGEQCEGSDSCIKCRFYSISCGDGKLDEKEECDNGPQNSTLSDADCRPDCSLSRCGDGIIDSTELCDDGNRLNGDSCDRFCLVEDGEPGVTVIPSDGGRLTPTQVAAQFSQQQQNQYQQQFGFPQYPNYQQLPYQLPLAQLQPLIQAQGPIGDTGPAAVAVVASGMAAGIGWMRKKKRK
jgi:cysteine-rich repeat protein